MRRTPRSIIRRRKLTWKNVNFLLKDTFYVFYSFIFNVYHRKRTNIIIKMSIFVHYFYREGGYPNLKPIFTIIFFTFRVGRGGIRAKSTNFIFSSVFFFLNPYLSSPIVKLIKFVIIHKLLLLDCHN